MSEACRCTNIKVGVARSNDSDHENTLKMSKSKDGQKTREGSGNLNAPNSNSSEL